ncbi:MAG: J domain-containing protein [Spirulinaceae cyanobacterium]
MNQERVTEKSTSRSLPAHIKLAHSHYDLLGLHPSASVVEVRRSYRELSKCYHPDTTNLPIPEATIKFQQLNEAYATLSNPELRSLYDHKIGYSRYHVIQPPLESERGESSPRKWSNSAYLDPTDRPLSSGELFALFILGLTFIGCLMIAIFIGLTRGDTALQVSHFTKIHFFAITNFQTVLKVLFLS